MANNRFGLSDSLISAVRDVCNEKVTTKEELKGDQHKLDVAEPKGKLTSADFKKLQAGKEQVNVKPDLPESMHDDDGWYAHREIHGSKGISAKDWKAGWRLNSKGQRVQTKKEELKGDQHKLDVAEPKGKLTSADSKKLQTGKEQVNVKPDLPESMHSIGSKDRITRENPWVTIYKPTDSGYEKGAPAIIGSMDLNTAAKIHGFKIDPESLHKAGVDKRIPVKNRYGKEMFVALSPHHAKASRAAVSALGSTNEEVEQVDEREMTAPEMKKREKIVMSMKKNLAGFKERYGKRGKDVMYATATKMAMKDED